MAAMPPQPLMAPTQAQPPTVLVRTTAEGRVLHYKMSVIQQPMQARACGAGPKSSADRRPIDPPPLVEFNVFEEVAEGELKDITFKYNTNFFCFAQLEHVPTMVDGVLQTPPATPPVLTGMPVSSINYLDRPREAGYFLFPDLSVRHEGKHCLRFSLYEEPKEKVDQDGDSGMSGADDISGPEQRNVVYRMDVKTEPFDVYSAKKFPGLMQSTDLSRVIAEQGCRVRVRRDVRMRRRDAKGKDNEDEYGARKARPEIRARSSSNASSDRVPQGPGGYRRLSIAESGSSGLQNLQPYPMPVSNGHLDFASQSRPNFAPPELPISASQPPQAYMTRHNGFSHQEMPHQQPRSVGPSYNPPQHSYEYTTYQPRSQYSRPIDVDAEAIRDSRSYNPAPASSRTQLPPIGALIAEASRPMRPILPNPGQHLAMDGQRQGHRCLLPEPASIKRKFVETTTEGGFQEQMPRKIQRRQEDFENDPAFHDARGHRLQATFMRDNAVQII